MDTLTLHTCQVHKTRAAVNRAHILFHFTATLAVLCYRISHLFQGDVHILAWGLITVSELIFTFVWLHGQAFRWRPVTRAAYPENISDDVEFPGIDVFICTADPEKEPTVEVMNTVLSAMALNYPPEKLAVYLSDDGGSPLTLYAIKEACLFARSWVPFCRRNGIKSRCPEAYFSAFGDDERLLHWSDEYAAEEEKIRSMYNLFKKNVENASKSGGIEGCVGHKYNRPPQVEVIHDNQDDGVHNNDQLKMPLLVYLSREKSTSHPHHFKAGALNALLRVSGIMSNGPYVLVLDCDMYCNDPASAQQAMCLHLDPNLSRSLAFVQYPQIFYNVSKNDIYDGQARSAYKVMWQGMDGLSGPTLTGTGYYLKRKALYGCPNEEDAFLCEVERSFGLSSKFIASLKGINDQDTIGKGISSNTVLEEAINLASCTFENNTKWGKEMGYSYDCLLESTFTGYLLHCKGWKSVYLYPKRPCFLGCATTNMKDALVQRMKWSSGLFQFGFSRFSPLTYGMSKMSILQSMCYGFFTFSTLLSFAFLLYGIVPQLCLLVSIPLYPKVSNPWFAVFAIVYASDLCQQLHEVLSTGGSFRTWWNEQRMRVMKSITGSLFGCLDVVMKWFGIAKANFRLTNKAIEQEELEKYRKGIFNFQGAEMFMLPLKILVILNMICLISGVKRMMTKRNFEEMFGQVFICSFSLVLSYPILVGMIPKKR